MRGPVAQWIRHLTTNQGIPGSNPGPVAQWIRHLTTIQQIPGSNPGGVDYFS